MYGGEGLRGECKHPLALEMSCLLHVSPGRQHDREGHCLRKPSRSKCPVRARPGVVRDTGSLAMVHVPVSAAAPPTT